MVEVAEKFLAVQVDAKELLVRQQQALDLLAGEGL